MVVADLPCGEGELLQSLAFVSKHIGEGNMAEAVADLEADLNNLVMSEEVEPLYAAVKKFIAEEVEPNTPAYFEAEFEHGDRWSLSPRQEDILGGLKTNAKTSGLWNFFLPDAETGEGLKNLDYAYIAAETWQESHRLRVSELQRTRHRQHGGAGALRNQRNRRRSG